MALDLFSPIAGDYQIWSRVLSFGQDPHWRRVLLRRMEIRAGSKVVDVAAGTGEVSRLLRRRGLFVISMDLNPRMLAEAKRRGATAVLGRAEELPFPNCTFDALTFTYLLRYVEDALACVRELVRILRPGGKMGMVDFGRPGSILGAMWWLYTSVGLPLAGRLIAPGWQRVGSFLGPSIDELHRRFPGDELVKLWEEAGLTNIRVARPSFGGGLIMWGRKK